MLALRIKGFVIFRADHKMRFAVRGRPAGQGQLNVPWLLELLRAYARDLVAILELWPPPERTPAETIRKEDDWAKGSVAYLRALTLIRTPS